MIRYLKGLLVHLGLFLVCNVILIILLLYWFFTGDSEMMKHSLKQIYRSIKKTRYETNR